MELKCNNCNKGKKQLMKYSIFNQPICKVCKICINCAKKYYSNNDLELCKKCCHGCKRCKKVMLKNNWPEDIIKFGKCNKCNHLCHKCEKYVMLNKLHYKKNSIKFCESCFREKYQPKDIGSKYTIVSKDEEDGNLFMRWKKTHEYILCDSCDKMYWKYIGFSDNICKSCKCNKIVKTNDPSTKTDKYKEYKINNEVVWRIESKRKKCFNCYDNLWINIDNLVDGNQYYCSKCPPNIPNQKLKYNKDKQLWIPYRINIKCSKCLTNKWIFSSNTNETTCKKCKAT